jgi:hypothetical protein
MTRLIEIANKDIREYLLSLVGTEQGKHLIVADIEANKFSCMGTDIDWKDVPDDLDLTGYDVGVVNVLSPEGSLPCCLAITFSEYRNRINIQLPMWIRLALFSAMTQGQNSCIDLLTKLKFENGLTHKGEEIPYSNTVG